MYPFSKIIQRFRFPVTLPEDITDALGIQLPKAHSFEDFWSKLTTGKLFSKRLFESMPRRAAEMAFSSAQRKEHFKENTIFSYYFNEGWMIFVLRFDANGYLRGLHLRHERIEDENGIKIALRENGSNTRQISRNCFSNSI